MARKKIREHDGKRLIRQNIKRVAPQLNLDHIRSVLVTKDTNWRKLGEENAWLNETKLVAKPDMLFGKRGKNNLVLLNATLAQCQEFCDGWLAPGKEATVGALTGPLTHFLLEPFVPHTEEYYLSVVASDRSEDVISFSPKGGVDVEENWATVRQLRVPMAAAGSNLEAWEARGGDLAKALGIDTEVPEARRATTLQFVRAIYRLFEDLDFTTLEMNPFTFDAAGNAFPLDLVGEVDDTAGFKNTKKWEHLDFPNPFGRALYPEEQFIAELDEKTGASLKLTVINPRGRVWLMVAGGGASVIYADTVADLGFGGELANYGEYSGAPNEEETYKYARTILDLATRDPHPEGKALIIGGGVANFSSVLLTFKGIAFALKEFRQKLIDNKMRIWVRRGGPGFQQGLKLMRDLGDTLGVPIEVFGPEVPMTSVLPLAIAYIKAGATATAAAAAAAAAPATAATTATKA